MFYITKWSPILGLKNNGLVYISLLAILMNLIFPKCGIYIGQIPLTFGYLLLSVSSLSCIFYFIFQKYFFTPFELMQISHLFVFFLICLVSLLFDNYDTRQYAGVLAYFLSITFIPVFSILSVGYLLKTNPQLTINAIENALKILLIFSIIHFLVLNFFHRSLGIPYLTTTGNNLLNFMEKCNLRGYDIYKAFSTYNNGNILGINLLLWIPFFFYRDSEKRKWRWFSRILLLFTLSRSVWYGLMILETMIAIFYNKKNIIAWLNYFIVLLILIVGTHYLSGIMYKDASGFLFDSSMGRRLHQLSILSSFTAIGHSVVSDIQEIVYTSVLRYFGFIGLLFFLATYAFPIFIPIKNRKLILIKIALIVYFFNMLMDGTFIYIPTQFTYWAIASFILVLAKKNGCGDEENFCR